IARKRALAQGPAREQTRELISRQWYPAALALSMAVLAFWSLMVTDVYTAWLLPVSLANLAMLGLALYLIRVGVREDRVRPFGAGIVYFLVWTFARYLDLFGAAGAVLGAAAPFALCPAGFVRVARLCARA